MKRNKLSTLPDCQFLWLRLCLPPYIACLIPVTVLLCAGVCVCVCVHATVACEQHNMINNNIIIFTFYVDIFVDLVKHSVL